MIRHVFYNPTTGRVTQTSSGGDPNDISSFTGWAWIESAEPITGEAWVDYAGDLHVAPPQPSAHHEWDWTTRAWQPRLDKLRASLAQKVNETRDAIIASPIKYQGANIDADAVSQRNISSKILEMQQRAVLNRPIPVDERVWLDHDNVLHSFGDDAAYLAWLGGLAISITERGTLVYGWSWRVKAQLAAASTTAQLMAVDLAFPA